MNRPANRLVVETLIGKPCAGLRPKRVSQRTKAKLAVALPLVDVHVIYVHRCNGCIDKWCPATNLQLTANEVLVLNDGDLIASYPRSDVYFATKTNVSPPVMC